MHPRHSAWVLVKINTKEESVYMRTKDMRTFDEVNQLVYIRKLVE